MAVKKTIPCRGIRQNWYGDKEQEMLKNNKEYAIRSINNNLLGSPPFEEYKSFLIKPSKSNTPDFRKGTDKKRQKK